MYVFEGRIENILPMVSVYAGWNPPRDMNLSVFHFRYVCRRSPVSYLHLSFIVKGKLL